MNAPMPEDGRGALEQHIVDRLDLILRLMLGNGEVGILEQVRQNKREIERLRNERSDGNMKFWAKVALLATAIGGVMEVVGRILGGG